MTIVVKHNIPVCVLLKPEIYDGIVEILEDYRQFFEANKHLKNTESEKLISYEKQLNDLGMGTSDLKDVDKDIVTLEKTEPIDLSVNESMDEILLNRISSLRAQIAVHVIRKQANLDGLNTMTDNQVNEIVAKTRLDRKRKRGHSPLDVPGVGAGITRQEILDSIHERGNEDE